MLEAQRMKPDRIKNWPSQERPRERLITEGAERLTDAELLAIILRVGRGTFKAGVSGQTAISLARSLLVEFRGLHGLDRAHISDLLKVKGLSVAKVSQIKAAFELGKRLRTNAVRPRSFDSASEVAAYLEPRLANARQEIAVALLLDGQNRLLDEKVIAEGTPTRATVYIRRVLEEALHASAASIVLAHNHPSGNPSPSPGDDETTRDLDKGARLIGLVLIDHVIIGEAGHYSYADSGRLQQFRES
jgi:DNA repair protein RadC